MDRLSRALREADGRRAAQGAAPHDVRTPLVVHGEHVRGANNPALAEPADSSPIAETQANPPAPALSQSAGDVERVVIVLPRRSAAEAAEGARCVDQPAEVQFALAPRYFVEPRVAVGLLPALSGRVVEEPLLAGLGWPLLELPPPVGDPRFAPPPIPEPTVHEPTIAEPQPAAMPASAPTDFLPPGEAGDQYRSFRDRVLEQFPAVNAALVFAPAEPREEGPVLAYLAAAILEKAAGDILLVDAAGHYRGLAQLLGTADEHGMIDVVRDPAAWSAAVRPTQIEELDVLLLGAMRAEAATWGSLLSEWKRRYRFVLIAAAAPRGPTEAALHAAADGVYLSVQLGSTSHDAMSSVETALSAAGARLLGCVVLQK